MNTRIYIACIFTILITFPISSIGGWWWSSEESENSTDSKSSTEEESKGFLDSTIEKAKEVSEQTTEAVGKLSDNIVEQAGNLTSNTKDWTLTKLRESVEQFDYYKDVMKQAGFQYSGLYVNIGLTGGLDFYFVLKTQLTKEQQNTLLEKYKDDNISTFMLKTIFDTPALLSLPDHTIEEVSVSFLSIPPKVAVMLVSPHSPFKRQNKTNHEGANDHLFHRHRIKK